MWLSVVGCVNVICSDKTGTLTQNCMDVTDIYTTSCQHAKVVRLQEQSHDRSHDDPRGHVMCGDDVVSPTSHPDISKVIEVGCVCNNAQLRDGKILGVPTEGAILAVSRMVSLPHCSATPHLCALNSARSEQPARPVCPDRGTSF